MTGEEKPTTAHILSLIGGILILIGGLTRTAMMGLLNWGMGSLGMMDGWMKGRGEYMIGGRGFLPSMFFGIGILSVVCGIIVIVGAVMLNSKPQGHSKWGTLILVFSLLSLIGAGGFLAGLILGVVGGALAISWKPK